MRRNRVFIVLLVIVTILAMATTALAGRPADKPDPPGKPTTTTTTIPEIWTCAERVKNGAIWLPGRWEGDAYVSDVSDPTKRVDVDVPLCIDIEPEHRLVEKWTVTWVGETARKDPKGLMFIFEEEIPRSHYAELEVLPTAEDDIRSGTREMTLDFVLDEDGVFGDEDDDVEHLVFLAMGHQGDKWENLEFTVTPNP